MLTNTDKQSLALPTSLFAHFPLPEMSFSLYSLVGALTAQAQLARSNRQHHFPLELPHNSYRTSLLFMVLIHFAFYTHLCTSENQFLHVSFCFSKFQVQRGPSGTLLLFLFTKFRTEIMGIVYSNTEIRGCWHGKPLLHSTTK